MEKEKIFKEICECVTSGLRRDAESFENAEKLMELYNQYQEDEQDGVDYIFDINNAEDLKCCIDGGLTSSEIASLCNRGVRFFNFGVNYSDATPVTNGMIMQRVIDNLNEIAFNVVKFAASGNSIYAWAYETYVVPNE